MSFTLHEYIDWQSVSYYGLLRWINDTHIEELALCWIQYKNSLKYKVGCFWVFPYILHNQLSSVNFIIAQMSEKHDSSNRQ